MSGCRGAAKIVKSGDRTNAAIIHVGHSDRSANNASQNDGCRSIRTNSSCKVAGFLPAGSPLAGQPVAAAQARWDLGSLPEEEKMGEGAKFKSVLANATLGRKRSPPDAPRPKRGARRGGDGLACDGSARRCPMRHTRGQRGPRASPMVPHSVSKRARQRGTTGA